MHLLSGPATDHTGRRRSALMALALAPATLGLAACASPGEAEAAYADLPGVATVDTTCDAFHCDAAVTMAEDFEAADLAGVLAAARDTDASTRVGARAHDLEIHVSDAGDASRDMPIAEAVLELSGSMETLEVVLTADAVNMTATTDPATPFWTTAENAWDALDETPGSTFQVTRPGEAPARVVVRGSWPEDAVALARAIDEDSHLDEALTGVVLTPEALSLGAVDTEAADALRAHVAQHDLGGAVPLRVPVTRELLTLVGDSGAAPDEGEVVRLAERHPAVREATQGPYAVEIRMAPGSLGAAADLYGDLHDAATDSGATLDIDLPRGLGTTDIGIELLPGSDPALVALVQNVAKALPDTDQIHLHHPNEAPSLVVTDTTGPIREVVEQLGRVTRAWAGGSTPAAESLQVDLSTTDLGNAEWWVDLTDPALPLEHPSDDMDEALQAAWADGVTGQ